MFVQHKTPLIFVVQWLLIYSDAHLPRQFQSKKNHKKINIKPKLFYSNLSHLFRTFDITHSRLVTFRVIKNSSIKVLIFLILHKLGLLYIFNLKYAFKC